MEKLIPVINKLLEVFNAVGTHGIDLPQIVVIGSQSSGKSSVLENIVGRDFLPRGTGIVTRRPLIIQLINLPCDGKLKDNTFEEWGEFLHASNPFYDFSQIREEIQRETDRTVGTNKGVSYQPITLKIYSPHVLNLTLVDLPGMTRVPVGDQPKDIDKQIREMSKSYISNPNAIIVAVTPANIDLANSDALQLAKEVDPEGIRTIGVITKIDLMDKGTNAFDILTNQVLTLRLGFIGIVSRSQQDIVENKTIKESLQSEKLFFQNHPVYQKIAHKHGTGVLALTLNNLLLEHIRNCLPELKHRITGMLAEAEKGLLSYGNPLHEKTSKSALLLSILTKFSNDYTAAIEGKLTDITVKELNGGARIHYTFNQSYVTFLKTMSPFDGLDDNHIRTAIRNAAGTRALFEPEVSFELLTKRQIKRLLDPSLQCVDHIYEELLRIVSQIESKELYRFSVLREKVVEVVTDLLIECKNPTKEMVENLVNIELAFINTAHPDFIGAEGAINQIVNKKVAQREAVEQQKIRAQMEADQAATRGGRANTNQPRQPASTAQQAPAPPPRNANQQPSNQPPQTTPSHNTPGSGKSTSRRQEESSHSGGLGILLPGKSKSKSQKSISLDSVPNTIKADGPLSDKECTDTELIKSLMDSYFNIVRKNTQDTVPKSIMYFLVTKSKDTLHDRLVERLYKEEMFEELLGESPEIVAQRNNLMDTVSTLRRALEILNELRDFSLR